ncbi:MAG: hypothetical protein E7257_09555 [Lachnospiraceae bacterium]|nr:hypothetical protein [Lachnospiraceae bacterium]
MKKQETETNINLGLEYNTGSNKVATEPSTQEETQIEKSLGRNEKDKVQSDSAVSGIANFRILANNQ